MKKMLATVFVAFIMLNTVSAQERPLHEVYSMMVYNFTRYVQWPSESGSGDFVIGVIGNKEVFKTLEAWYGGKPRGEKTYAIKYFSSANEVTDCHVIYLDKSKSNDFPTVNERVKGRGTLVITDKTGLGEQGSSINFKTVNNKLKFELNQKAVESSNLKVASTLTAMAILI
jgi:hypothetical protein